MVQKLRLSSKKTSFSYGKTPFYFPVSWFCLSEDGVSVENKPETGGKFRRLIYFAFLFCCQGNRGSVLWNFVNSTIKKASMFPSKPSAYSLISFSSVVSAFFGVKLNFFQYHINQIFHRFVIILAEFALCSTCNDVAYCQCPMSQHRSEGIEGRGLHFVVRYLESVV